MAGKTKKSLITLTGLKKLCKSIYVKGPEEHSGAGTGFRLLIFWRLRLANRKDQGDLSHIERVLADPGLRPVDGHFVNNKKARE